MADDADKMQNLRIVGPVLQYELIQLQCLPQLTLFMAADCDLQHSLSIACGTPTPPHLTIGPLEVRGKHLRVTQGSGKHQVPDLVAQGTQCASILGEIDNRANVILGGIRDTKIQTDAG